MLFGNKSSEAFNPEQSTMAPTEDEDDYDMYDYTDYSFSSENQDSVAQPSEKYFTRTNESISEGIAAEPLQVIRRGS